jgi:hypothetical protein
MRLVTTVGGRDIFWAECCAPPSTISMQAQLRGFSRTDQAPQDGPSLRTHGFGASFISQKAFAYRAFS